MRKRLKFISASLRFAPYSLRLWLIIFMVGYTCFAVTIAVAVTLLLVHR